MDSAPLSLQHSVVVPRSYSPHRWICGIRRVLNMYSRLVDKFEINQHVEYLGKGHCVQKAKSLY